MTFIPPTEFAEDVAHTSGDKGIQSLAVRKDTAVALAADGDYEPLIVDSTGKLHVNVGTSALPSGAATSALQTQPGVDIGDVTINNVSGASAVNIQDGGNSITVDGTVAFSNTTIAVTNVGTFAVQNTAATPAGTNNIGDIDVLTVGGQTPAFGTGARSAATQRVTIATDDVVPISDNGGSITVDGTVAVSGTVTVGSHAVTNAGTFVVQENGAALTALQLLDDTVATLGTTTYTEASTKGAVIGAVRRDANTSLVDTTNEVAPLQVNATGELKVAQIQALPAGTNNIGDIDVLTIGGQTPAFGTGARSAATQRVTIATDDVVPVSDNGGSLTVDGTVAATQSGTWTVQPGNTANTTAWKVDGSAVTQPVSIATNTPVGNVAHDAADSGAPIKIGGRARTSEIAAVSSDDRVDAIYDKVGKQVVLPYAVPENFVSGAITTAMTGTTSTSLVSAPAGSLRNYITTIIVSNSHATVGTDVIIQDGSGGTTLLTIPAAAAYGGATITLPTPLRQPTTATAIYCANVTTGSSTKVSAVGYTGL